MTKKQIMERVSKRLDNISREVKNCIEAEKFNNSTFIMLKQVIIDVAHDIDELDNMESGE